VPLLACEPGVEEGAHEFGREFRTDDARAEREHVHVVVLDALVRGIGVVAHARADAAHLVRGHARADAAPAQQHTALGLALLDGLADRAGVVGVVHRVGRVGAEVNHLVAFREDRLDDFGLEREAPVVAGNGDFHGSSQKSVAKRRRKAQLLYNLV